MPSSCATFAKAPSCFSLSWPGLFASAAAPLTTYYLPLATDVLASQRNSAFPGNEVALAQNFRLRMHLAACHTHGEVQNRLAHLLDCFFAGHDGARINIDNVAHAPRQIRIRRNLNHWRNRISSRCAKACRK